jgi:type I restriction enzyme M protein
MGITQPELESYLWGAATILRGTIDAGDYKESEGDVDFASFAENHRFQMPDGAHWEDVRAVATNVGRALQSAMQAIEQANPDKLRGVFGEAQWTNKERLSDATLRDLVEHFSRLSLSAAEVPEDQFGQAYEYLIRRFADDSGHTAQEFYTNRTLVHLMTVVLDPQPGDSVYDPTCGTGGMLVSAVAELKRKGKEFRNLKLYGQELNLMSSSIARMNLFLHGIMDFDIERGNTLSEPKFLEGDRLKRFDVVLANPPYSIKQWNRDLWAADPYGRNRFGTPPQGRADYAFFQHILASMRPGTGRCAILFPHGILFRNEERAMRRSIVKADLIDCVLGLGPGLFYNSPMEASVLFCRSEKPQDHRGKVLFVNAANDYGRLEKQSFLRDVDIDRVANAIEAWKDEPGFAKVVDVEDLASNDFSLNIPLYCPLADSPPPGAAVSTAAAIDAWRAEADVMRAREERVLEVLEALK